MSKERPILFSRPMVRALLDGTKTQTRRVAKTEITMGCDSILAPHRGQKHAPIYLLPEHAADAVVCCPYGQPDERLWVRESFGRVPTVCGSDEVVYAADYRDGSDRAAGVRYTPSIYMPRWASRITLEVTNVRVERLQDISEADALAEGVKVHPDHHGKPPSSIYSPVQAYRDLWESIHGPDSWAANPWVWAIEFRRLP